MKSPGQPREHLILILRHACVLISSIDLRYRHIDEAPDPVVVNSGALFVHAPLEGLQNLRLILKQFLSDASSHDRALRCTWFGATGPHDRADRRQMRSPILLVDDEERLLQVRCHLPSKATLTPAKNPSYFLGRPTWEGKI
eukprot:scaffold367_cov254-Pinguiococcus_pyrenoidosus.AAC.8